jgi:phage terminase large subunit-like protein
MVRGDGEDFRALIEASCRITKDSVAGPSGQLLVLRPWQRVLTSSVFARRVDGQYKHRQALIGIPRKNGKSGIGSGWAIASMLLGPAGGEVYACAGDKDQARIVFGDAKRMVEMDPDLSALMKPYKDAIEVPSTGTVFRVLSAEAYTKEGKSPTCTLFDEVHVQPNRELWDVMALAQGARRSPIMIGITTAGVRYDSSGQDSLCYTMYEYGKKVASGEVSDPSFFFAWWEPKDPNADHRAESTWQEANPGYGDIVDAEDFQSAVGKTPEAEFRIKRTNQWVSTAATWLPAGVWDKLGTGEGVPDLAEVVLGFDGSYNGDSTALVVASCGAEPHLDVVEVWEKPADALDEWRVPILDVEQAIRDACKKWQVREIVCDPYRWARSYQILEGEGLPIVEYPQTPARMGPATSKFYEAVTNNALTHSGNATLARHIGNCVYKTDSRGARVTKESQKSSRKIDAAIAGVMAYDRATVEKTEPEVQFFSWNDL